MDFTGIIRAFIASNKSNILRDITTLINIEGHYTEKAYVEEVRDWVRHAFEQEGFKCHTEEVAENRCGLLSAV
ncbi:MAG: hypothetical protein MJ194_07760 [Clostridia bacterium]|nr:hypothetical protein [Clostridia bacterium]